MYGLVTGDAALAREDAADVTYFVADHVDGQRENPLADAVNSVACWGNTQLVGDDPDRAAVSADGTRATTDVRGHHWGTVCPTDPAYRETVLERVERVGAVGDVRLTTVGFPGPTYCHCGRCDARFDASDRVDRTAWRSEVITAFVSAAAERVQGDLWTTLAPDPYPGDLRERRGLDPTLLADHVDGFYVPMCSVSYETTYWVETLARGFASELAEFDVPLALHLSATDVDVDRIVDLGCQIEPYADVVVFSTTRCDPVDVWAVIERLRDPDRTARTA